MLFERIFVEKQVQQHPQTLRVQEALPKIPVTYIDKISDVFEKARKPYLQKRDSLNLFLGRKEGQLVKEAPDAYGLSGDPHYYFIHAYNCIYECEYCYLQGYFHSPDLVMFVNHDEILAEMKQICRQHSPEETVWFHAGEFSDSLALAHLSGELPEYWDFFREMPNARMELRTKSVNIKPLLTLGPLENIIITFSLSPSAAARQYDRKTPSTQARLNAMKRLADAGFQMGIHLDPIVYDERFESDYQQLVTEMLQAVPVEQVNYISLGVVRFTRDVFHEFSKNYPKSGLLAGEFVKSFDNKVRYNRPQRLYLLKTVQRMCVEGGVAPEKVYLCMEAE